MLKFRGMKRRGMGVAANVCAALAFSIAALAQAPGQAAPQGTQAPPSPADGIVLAEQYF